MVRRPTQDEWTVLEPTIISMYAGEKLTARHIMTILKEAHGFSVTVKQLRDRFRKWQIDTKNVRRKRKRPAEAHHRTNYRLPTVAGHDQDMVQTGSLTDDNLLIHTVEHAERLSGNQLLLDSRPSTPGHLSNPDDPGIEEYEASGMFQFRPFGRAIWIGDVVDIEFPLFAESSLFRRVLYGIKDFYTSFHETNKPLRFCDAGSSLVIDFTNDLTHALDIFENGKTQSARQLVQTAFHMAANRLNSPKTSHPDGLVYLLKFLVHVWARGRKGKKHYESEYLTKMAGCKFGISHPIALLFGVLHAGSQMSELCKKAFDIMSDPIPSPNGREVQEDLQDIRHLYSHILIYQEQFAEADEILLRLGSMMNNPAKRVGPLRTLAHSRRRQDKFPAAQEALEEAWQTLERFKMQNSGRGALILQKLAEIAEDMSDLHLAESHLFRALRIQKNSLRPDRTALARRVMPLARLLQKQGKYSVLEELRQEYPQAFT